MKKNYFFAALLILAFAVNLNAQFVELEGKEPAFHIKFEGVYPGGKLVTEGTQMTNFVAFDGTEVTEGDTVRGHGWGGGVFDVFTFQEQIVNSENFDELFLPTMHWDSYVSEPTRPQGIAAYTDGHGGYLGPIGTSPRTVSMYVFYTDSARVDTAGTTAWGGNHMLFDVGQWNLEGGGGMTRWLLDPATMKFQFDWGLAADFTAENMFERNKWVHLALTIPEGGLRDNVKLYVNGVLQEFVAEEATGSETTSLNTTGAAGWDGIRIGRLANVWMADYRVYADELSEVEVRKLLGLNAVSTPNYESKNLFNIYPVPNNGIFTVETAAPGVSNVIIRNTLGQVVHNQVVGQKQVVDVSNLSTGMYFVTLSDSKNNVEAKKILIK